MALGEVAAAFAGFSGVVAALGYGPSGWSEAARYRFTNLLCTSVAASLLAFLPVTLEHFAMSSPTAWAWSSAALALFCLSFLLFAVRRGFSIAAKSEELRWWIAVVFVCGLVGVAIAQVANIATSPAGRGGAPYVAGILVLLALSGVQFVALALGSISRRA